MLLPEPVVHKATPPWIAEEAARRPASSEIEGSRWAGSGAPAARRRDMETKTQQAAVGFQQQAAASKKHANTDVVIDDSSVMWQRVLAAWAMQPLILAKHSRQ